MEPFPLHPPLPHRRTSRPGLHLALAVGAWLTAAFAGGLLWVNPGAGVADAAVPLGVRAAQGALYATCLFAILGAHEWGHYTACRRYGIEATLPFFLPGIPPLGTFGALIRIRGAIPGRRALFDVAAAGPLYGFAVAVPLLIAAVVGASPAPEPVGADEPGWYFGEPLALRLLVLLLRGGGDIRPGPVLMAAWVGLFVTSMNLFPVGQLDGGHAAYALSRRAHRWASYATLVGLGGLVVYQTWVWRAPSVYTLWLAILLYLRDRHPRLLDEAEPLAGRRRALAVALAAVFVLTFIPVPIRIVGP